MNNILNNLTRQNPIMLAGGALLIVAGFYFIGRKAISDTTEAVAGTIGGVVSGNNKLTEETPYEGAGVLGTVGAATNTLLGGVPRKAGEALGGWIYNLTHSDELY